MILENVICLDFRLYFYLVSGITDCTFRRKWLLSNLSTLIKSIKLLEQYYQFFCIVLLLLFLLQHLWQVFSMSLTVTMYFLTIFWLYKWTLDIVKERCLFIYSQQIFTKHLHLNWITRSSPRLKDYTKYITILVFEG